jgi:hypothetical protein
MQPSQAQEVTEADMAKLENRSCFGTKELTLSRNMHVGVIFMKESH